MHSVNYANERKQFGTVIANFGAIKHKLAEQVIRQFVSEAAVYRASKVIDDCIKRHIAEGMEKTKAYIEALSEYAMEAAILKVFCSETLDFIVDEAVQIYGGMGYSAEVPVERAYRDSRINRIFEGTNEINRLVASDMYLKMAKKAGSEIFSRAKAIFDDIDNLKTEAGNGSPDYFGKKYSCIENMKKAVILILGKAYEAINKQYSNEQEIMMNISDMLTQLYAAESAVLRVEKLKSFKPEDEYSVYKDICDVFLYEAASSFQKSATDAICSFANDGDLAKMLKALRHLTHTEPVNIKEARRRVANKLIEDNNYRF
jgi:alkylation response protein AidB-like acyl-CoA dehydrogenase